MSRRATGFQLLLGTLLAVLATGCATPKPYFSGRSGLLDRLGNRGQAVAGLDAEDAAEARRQAKREGAAAEIQKVDLKGLSLRWPLNKVGVTSNFGDRGRQFHEGIDLRAPIGTPVYAAESGRVLYADKRIGGYGKMIVLRHANGFATVYGHNSKLLVRRGQRVTRGQKIALSGNSGRSSGPHVHFEIRSGVVAIDPRRVLAEPRTTVVEAPKLNPKAASAPAKKQNVARRGVASASKRGRN